jgi:transcription-repair coupling factor (superfamily II helicase)
MRSVRFTENASLLCRHGITEPAAPYFAQKQILQAKTPITVIFLKDMTLAESWAEDIPFFSNLKGELSPLITLLHELPEDESSELKAFDQECDRVTALTHLLDYKTNSEGKAPLVILTTPHAFFLPTPKAEKLQQDEIRLIVGGEYSFKELIRQLTENLRYDHEAVCEMPGQFAVRGGIIDVYPVNAEAPYRLDFFGDEIDEIRTFDPTTQRTQESKSQLVIALHPESGEAQHAKNIFNYFGNQVQWIFHEPGILADRYKAQFTTMERSPENHPTLETLFKKRGKNKKDTWVGYCDLEADIGIFEQTENIEAYSSETLDNYREVIISNTFGNDKTEAEIEARINFLEHAIEWQSAGEVVQIIAGNDSELDRIRTFIAEESRLKKLSPIFRCGSLRKGFRIKDGETRNCFITANDIYRRHRLRPAHTSRRSMPQRSQVDHLLDFSELIPGEHLVHLSHGICVFRGLNKLEINGSEEEVISLEFENSLTMHLRLHESHLLTRYVGLSKQRPKLGKPGSGMWTKTRHAAEEATLDFAADLLKTQAQRKTEGGFACEEDSLWQKEFEAAFIYKETPDQLKAIEETKGDMEQPISMDRLICGDVGFGKTEVAIRAAFKAVMNGKQVALLVPTTVLAQQHFNTFTERMASYPIGVEMLSRFRSTKQRKQIIEQLALGKIDILIGTHSILSDEVNFKDLGLLIIDEEHRFGVAHKERLKSMKENLDVITMSATPIPRTLYMALMGARDLSVIETPPVDRLPIQTVVKNYDSELVKKAIQHELRRGGQVFYLHNRVQTIEAVAEQLREMVPEAKIVVGHGQMTEYQLEKIMTQFVAGEFDVLVCTTIIESGLDIPNSNTMIIEGADHFGLSQLYQIRGRVGRFNRQAYAYLLLHRKSGLLDQARKRLSAMKQYNELGSGFKIAMRDLELRGAGNILGSQQSGHIVGVGFDLYCQLLRQSISKLKGEPQTSIIRANVNLDFVQMGSETLVQNNKPDIKAGLFQSDEAPVLQKILAGIPKSYVSETQLRIDFYRKLALAAVPAEIDQIEETMIDRFGKLPNPVKSLLDVTKIRVFAEQIGIVSVDTDGNVLRCRKASGSIHDYLKIGNRFPRLTRSTPELRLQEIKTFLKRYLPTNPL